MDPFFQPYKIYIIVSCLFHFTGKGCVPYDSGAWAPIKTGFRLLVSDLSLRVYIVLCIK